VGRLAVKSRAPVWNALGQVLQTTCVLCVHVAVSPFQNVYESHQHPPPSRKRSISDRTSPMPRTYVLRSQGCSASLFRYTSIGLRLVKFMPPADLAGSGAASSSRLASPATLTADADGAAAVTALLLKHAPRPAPLLPLQQPRLSFWPVLPLLRRKSVASKALCVAIMPADRDKDHHDPQQHGKYQPQLGIQIYPNFSPFTSPPVLPHHLASRGSRHSARLRTG